MIEMNDDWELFVPVKGEKYPDACQYRYRRIDHEWSEWSRGPIGVADYPRNDIYQYRKPKQKENKMPDRTPQQALKDAIDSGAVDAWINGEEIQYRVHRSVDRWVPVESPHPDFALHGLEYRPKPPEPTRINWRPVVNGKEPLGLVLGVWYGTVAICTYAPEDGWRLSNDGSVSAAPKFYAPMCNLPEGDK